METRNSSMLGFVVVLVIGAGLVAGLLAFAGHGDSWSPRSYVPKPGDCLVYPQGDPLYDDWYKNVNKFNCDALKVQSQARNIDAQTHAVNVETQQNQITVYAVFGVVAGCLVLLVFAIITAGGRPQG